MRRTYRVHGLTLQTDLALPDELLVDDPDDRATITVTGGAPAAVDEAPFEDDLLRTDWGPTCILSVRQSPGGAFQVKFPRFLEWTISADLRSVHGWNDPGTDPQYLPITLLGGVAAFIVGALGDLCLHASALEISDGLVAFAGVSGQGKSTTATLVAASGAPCFADDVLRVRFVDGSPVADRGVAEARLREAAFSLADQVPSSRGSRETIDQRLAVRLQPSLHAELPLRVVALPRPNREIERVEVTVLDPRQAFLALHPCLRLTGWKSPEFMIQHFGLLGQLTDAVPVVEVHIPWGPPFPTNVGAEIVEQIELAIDTR